MPKRYFLLCASADHVAKGVAGSFGQAGHGKRASLDRMSKGDFIVYYSSKETMDSTDPLQQFTALGKVSDGEVFQEDLSENWKPFRRKIDYQKVRNTAIRPLLSSLGFVKNEKKWGFYVMSGFRELDKGDFDLIAEAMDAKL